MGKATPFVASSVASGALAPENIRSVIELLKQDGTGAKFAAILSQTQLFEDAKVSTLALQFRDQALRTVECAMLDTREMLAKFHPSVTFEAIMRLAKMGCPYNPEHGLGFIVEKKHNLVAMPGIRSMERIVQSDPRVKFIQAAAIRSKDKYFINRFDPRVPPLHEVALDVPQNEANPIIGSLATILIGDVFHSVVLRLAHAELAAEKGYMDVEDRAKYRALRAACREVINRYMRNDRTESAITELMSADQEAALMVAAQAGTQPKPQPSLPAPSSGLQLPAAVVPPALMVGAAFASSASPEAAGAPAPEPSSPVSPPQGRSPMDGIMERRGEAVDLPPGVAGRSSRRA